MNQEKLRSETLTGDSQSPDESVQLTRIPPVPMSVAEPTADLPTLWGLENQAKPPQQIGRYRVVGVLGQGGFASVYLAHDDLLFRHVAIKVPHPQLVARPEQAEAYLTEARLVASLDYPYIVPVYDSGSSP